jgi:hypothetical protein
MTYDDAKKWLTKIGGEWLEAAEQIRGRSSVIVCVKSASRGTVQRHRLFDCTLTGVARDSAIRQAFLDACRELRAALA